MKDTTGVRFVPSIRGSTRLVLLVGCLLAGGCGGGARLSLVPIDQGRISRTEPFVVELHAAECYYSIDGERIRIAIADENISLIGEWGKQSLVWLIVLDGLPAHNARDFLPFLVESGPLTMNGGKLGHAVLVAIRGVAHHRTPGMLHLRPISSYDAHPVRVEKEDARNQPLLKHETELACVTPLRTPDAPSCGNSIG